LVVLGVICTGEVQHMTDKTGVVAYQITDDVINETAELAKKATGVEKLQLYRKLRFMKNHLGKWLVKLV